MMAVFELSAGVNASNVFLIKHSELEGRIDPHQYHHERINAIKAIKAKNKTANLYQLVSSAKQITTEINSQDIYIGLENVVSHTGEYLATADKQSISSAGVFKKGQILFPKLRPYLNKVHLAEFDGICSTEFHIFNAKNINAEFLAIYLRSDLVVNQTKHLMTGNTLPRLQTEDIQKLPVPLVSSETQSQIVAFYKSAYNRKQQKEHQAQALLDSVDEYLLDALGIILPEKDSSLEKRIFTVPLSKLTGGRFDSQFYAELPDLNGYSKLSSFATVSGGKRLPLGEGYENEITNYLYLRVADINNIGEIDFQGIRYISQTAFDLLERYEITNKELAISIAGTIGRICLVDGIEKGKRAILTENCAKISLKTNAITANFFEILLNLPIVQKQIELGYIQTTIAKLGLERIKNLYLPPIPSIEKQNEIATHISQIRAQAKQLQVEAASILATTKADIERIILGDVS
jgi:type I restriction enzyme S subunit